MNIKIVAEKLNISARTIRFYEEKGLLAPVKREHNQYREFSKQDVWRLQTIISLREAGMSIADIGAALAEIDHQDHEKLLDYLELQRSFLFGKWLEMKQIIETTDKMIEAAKQERSLPLEAIYELAEGSKRLREQRKWQDQWNYDRLAPYHDQRVLDSSTDFKDYEQALDITAAWVAPAAGEMGLDIGVGTGNLAGKLIRLGAIMAGVDQSKEMLKQCKQKLPNMETKLGNFLAIPYMDNKFDFIVTSFAFHHLNEEQQVLALDEMQRVLKPRGRICITDLMTATHTHDKMDSPEQPQPLVNRLTDIFDKLGYVTKQQQINERLHIVYAVPIR